jgi:hypothetical protein
MLKMGSLISDKKISMGYLVGVSAKTFELLDNE